MSKVEDALKSAKETKALWIGTNVLSTIADLFREQFPGKNAVIIADNNTYEVAGRHVEKFISDAGIVQEKPFIFTNPDLHAEYKYIDELTSFLRTTDAIPVAVGSGTINDLTKLSSHLTDRRYICVATAASMDGYTSFGASITADGAKQTFNCPAPQACLADIEIIRKAPREMTAAGYADLFAKVVAGADWILADALDIEPIHKEAWNIVQGGLHDALSDPAGVKNGNPEAIRKLLEGLMLGGFAMQCSQTSRPASGAEHYFSHLWDMTHHTHKGELVSHGFQVSLGTVAITAFYEQLLKTPIENLCIEDVCNEWPTLEMTEQKILKMFKGTGFTERCLLETRAKYKSRIQVFGQLQLFKEKWPETKYKLENQLLPLEDLKMKLHAVGAPVEPEEISITRKTLRKTFIKSQYLRNRFTIIDLSVRTDLMNTWLRSMFGKYGVWKNLK